MSKRTCKCAQCAVMQDLLDRGIKANATAIAEVHLAGGIAVLVFDAAPSTSAAATQMGWDGKRPVFPMPHQVAKRTASLLTARGDMVTAKWLRRSGQPARIFVVMHQGTLLVNFEPGAGFWIEPGSTEVQHMN